MTTGIRSDASGTFGALTFGGDDAITFDAAGIQAGSYKAGSIVDTDLTLSANSAPVKVALNAAGAAPIFACRAWVNFNGTGTVAIRASGNVSSITDNGVGYYTVNFITAMPDINYGMFAQAGSGNGRFMSEYNGVFNTQDSSTLRTASSCRVAYIEPVTAVLIDNAAVYVSIIR